MKRQRKQTTELPEKPEYCSFLCPYSVEGKAGWGACQTFNLVYCGPLDEQVNKGAKCTVTPEQIKKYEM